MSLSETDKVPVNGQASGASDSSDLAGHIELKLDLVMVERHITLKDLADQVGISNVNLSKIKNNRVAAIRFSTLAGICRVLHCQPGDILEYVPDSLETR